MPKRIYRQEFRGRSFRGQDLADADFSNADIRGTDFSGAALIGANFSGAKAGLQLPWLAALTLVCLIIAVLSGCINAFSIGFFSIFLIPGVTTDPKEEAGLAGTIFSSIVLLVLGYTFFRVIQPGTKLESIIVSLLIISTTVAVVAATDESHGKVAVLAILSLFAIVGTMAGVMLWVLAWAIAVSLVDRLGVLIIVLGASLGSTMGVFLALKSSAEFKPGILPIILSVSGIFILLLFFFSVYVGKQVIAGNEKYALLRILSVFLTTRKGTCFKDADLTSANFFNASLEHTDLRAVKLTRTWWRNVKKINRALTIGTYLENPLIRELVVTEKSKNKKFEHLDLRGLNLQSANLQGFSFMGSNLSEADLRNADLSKVNFTQTQLYEAYLTSATLTGAYIQDWGISPHTKLQGIQCEYVYMRLPTEEDPDPCRKPDNKQKSFQAGDFSTFIAPIIKTLDLYYSQNIDPSKITVNVRHLDLYHHQGLDPRAAATAFVELAQEHPDANLEVISIEGRGEDRIRIQVNVSDKADRSELDKLYFSKYDQRQANPYPNLQSFLLSSTEKIDGERKDATLKAMRQQIQSLETLLETALKAKSFYIENAGNVGDNDMSSDRSLNIRTHGGSVDISGVVNLGEISGNVANSIAGLPSSSNNESGLKELLTELKAAIESEADLSPDDKAEALEQVKVLAEAGKKPEDSGLKKMAKTAVKVLKGTVAGLPDAAKLAEACSKLLPIIVSLLALV